jgi:fumarate reductase (CoM/CoB) subunit B
VRTFFEELETWTEYNLKNCIGVDECMKVCPVVDPDVTIKELNEATRPGTDVPLKIQKFAAECIQCGRCDTICPTVAGRSIMMLYLKAKVAMQGKQPKSYKKYLRMKGHDRNPLLLGINNLVNKGRIRELAKHVDKNEFKKAPLLFYFGCYLFTGLDSVHQTLAIADKLGLEYEVLGGNRSCCGWPQLLAGETDMAEDYHEYLLNLIRKSDPKEVVSGCAECYMSLKKVQRKYAVDFEPLTTTQWLLNHADDLDLKNTAEQITYHDSCHLSRKMGMPEPPRELLSKMVDVREMERSGRENTYCCGYWSMHANQDQTHVIHEERFEEVQKTGTKKMVCECITCAESFAPGGKQYNIEVEDIVQTVYNNVFQ